MRNRTFATIAHITANGGLQYFGGELKQFLNQHKNTTATITVDVHDKKSTLSHRGYFMKVIVPQFQRAFYDLGERLTIADTDERLRKMCVICCEEIADVETGQYVTRLKTLAELTASELTEMLDQLRQIGAEDFGVYIEDSNNI